jgi:hypothetical protein
MWVISVLFTFQSASQHLAGRSLGATASLHRITPQHLDHQFPSWLVSEQHMNVQSKELMLLHHNCSLALRDLARSAFDKQESKAATLTT